MKPTLSALVALLIPMFMAPGAQAAVQGKEVTYSSDGVTMKGYVAWDDAIKGKRNNFV